MILIGKYMQLLHLAFWLSGLQLFFDSPQLQNAVSDALPAYFSSGHDLRALCVGNFGCKTNQLCSYSVCDPLIALYADGLVQQEHIALVVLVIVVAGSVDAPFP